MAKIQLSPETRAKERRRPGFALLKISGWKQSPEHSEMAVQRSEDDKYLGTEEQWEPIPVWHTLANMTLTEDGCIEADVPPAFVDPIIASPNNSYRVTLKSEGAEPETRTMRIANGVLASSAAGSSPESLEQGKGLILGDAIIEPVIEPEPEPEPAVIEEDVVEKVAEETPEPIIAPAAEVKKDGFFALHKGKIISALIALLLIAIGLVWYFKLIPDLDFGGDNVEATAAKAVSATVDPASKKLTDLELLQQFIRTKPDTDQILAQAKAWGETGHCDAMLRLMVHSAHKSNDSKIAFEYAKMHDPAQFSKGACIEKPDVDTAEYWYQKAIEDGHSDAKSLLEKLEKK